MCDNLHGAVMEVGLRTDIEFVGSEDIPSTARLKIKIREIAGDLKIDTHNARAMTPTVITCVRRSTVNLPFSSRRSSIHSPKRSSCFLA